MKKHRIKLTRRWLGALLCCLLLPPGLQQVHPQAAVLPAAHAAQINEQAPFAHNEPDLLLGDEASLGSVWNAEKEPKETGEVTIELTSEAIRVAPQTQVMSYGAGVTNRNCFCCTHCTKCYRNGVRIGTTCACYTAFSGVPIYQGCYCSPSGCTCHMVTGPRGRGQLVYGAVHYYRALIAAASTNWGAKRVIYLGCRDEYSQAQAEMTYRISDVASVPYDFSGNDKWIQPPSSVSDILIVGRDPTNQKQPLYTSGVVYIRPLKIGATMEMADMVAKGNSNHGLICGGTQDGDTVTFTNVDFEGVEMCHNEGVNTTTIFESCNVLLNASQGRASLRWGHCQDVIVRGGKTYVNKQDIGEGWGTGTGVFAIAWTAESDCYLRIEQGAELVIESPLNNINFIEIPNNRARAHLILERNARLTVNMPGRFSGTSVQNASDELASIQIAEGATVTSNPNVQQLGSAGVYIPVKDLIVNGTLNANYYRQTSDSTGDICVKASNSMTVGPAGRVNIAQHGGIGSAIHARGFSSRGKVNVYYNPQDKDTAAKTSSALNIGVGLLRIYPTGELMIEHVRGRGTCVDSKGVIIEGGGLIDLYHSPSGNVGGAGNPSLTCSGDVVIENGAEMHIVQDTYNANSYGGNAVKITSNSAIIDNEGLFNVIQRAGTDTIANVGGKLTFRGKGLFDVSKESGATGTLVKAAEIDIQTNLYLGQNGGGNAIEANNLYVIGQAHSLTVDKTGGTGAVFSGGSALVDDGAALTFTQTAGDLTLSNINTFTARNGAVVRINRQLPSAHAVFTFLGGGSSALVLERPALVEVINPGGPMFSGAAGGMNGTISSMYYAYDGGDHLWSANLAQGDGTFSFSARMGASGLQNIQTSGLPENGCGAKPGEEPIASEVQSIADNSFQVFRAGVMPTIQMQPAYRGEQDIRGSTDANLTLTALEYTNEQSGYAYTGNRSNTGPGGQNFLLTMERQLKLAVLGRVYIQALHANGLEGYGFIGSDGRVAFEVGDLAFAAASVSPHDSLVPRRDADWSLKVLDSRGYAQSGQWNGLPWSLSVKANDVMTEMGGTQKLTGSRIVFRRSGETADAYLHPGVPVEVASGRSMEAGEEVLCWPGSEGFRFSLKADEGVIDKSFQCQLTWTLTI